MWLFGYGALMYKANFEYEEKQLGRVKDYNRRFYQQSVYDRGTEELPGLIATLVHSKGGEAWGVAYKLKPNTQNEVIKRITGKGGDGFHHVQVKFYPKKDALGTSSKTVVPNKKKPDEKEKKVEEKDKKLKKAKVSKTDLVEKDIQKPAGFQKPNRGAFNPLQAKTIQNAQDTPAVIAKPASLPKITDANAVTGDFITVTTYVAPSDNFLFSKTEDINAIAEQIFKAKGKMGTNIEYVLNMARGFRDLYPHSDDDHLFKVERKLIEMLGGPHESANARRQKGHEMVFIEK